MPKTRVASFVLRFTQELNADAEPTTPWRAVIRHVQTDQEAHFTDMEEVLAFIDQYVDLSDSGCHSEERSDEESPSFES